MSIGTQARTLKIFVSCPGDVSQERDCIIPVTQEINSTLGEKLGISFQVCAWKSLPPDGKPWIESIKTQLQNCDLFLMIFYRKYGTDPNQSNVYGSGTRQEFEIAKSLREERSHQGPQIFVYFREIFDQGLLEDAGPDLTKVLEFKKELAETIFFKEYPTPESFQNVVKNDLTSWCLDVAELNREIDPDNQRKKSLKNIFSLGQTSDGSTFSIIIYPSSTGGLPDELEHTRILPYISHEDFLAITEIERCLNYIGARNHQVCTWQVYRNQLPNQEPNKIFTCVPRNPPANEALRAITNKKFQVMEKGGKGTKKERYLEWQNASGKFSVFSPQRSYLSIQRDEISLESLKSDPGKCICVDFGVIARYIDSRNLSSIFFFGLRGLGTWGAAHYLAHYHHEIIKKVRGKSPIEILLRIEYQDYKLSNITDVSDHSSDYFSSELDEGHIKQNILEYQEKNGHPEEDFH